MKPYQLDCQNILLAYACFNEERGAKLTVI